MLVVMLSSHNPYFNLATEEYFLKQREEEFFLLWRNAPCVVVGRNQNTRKEINYEYVTEHQIPVVRRLTGGGTVFHDLGNLNFTLIQRGVEDRFGNYEVFAKPVIEALGELGVTATLSGRNDLLIGDQKFCGQAQTMWHGRLMHHGCILFSANVEALVSALKVNPLKIKSKGIDSVRSRVTNIETHLPSPCSVEGFAELLKNRFLAVEGNTLYEVTAEDLQAIEQLVREKYETFDWNFGFSKEYSFQKDSRFSAGTITVSMEIRENAIWEMEIAGDFFGVKPLEELEEALKGVPYEEGAVKAALEQENLKEYMAGISVDEMLTAMF